jgi:WD40 repeat protein
VASGQELQTLYGNLSNVFGVAFSPDSSQLVTAGGDGTVRTYTLSLDQLVTLAQERLTRGLTDEECRKFLHVDACP